MRPGAAPLPPPLHGLNRDVSTSVSCGSTFIPRGDSVLTQPVFTTDPGTGHVFICRSDIRVLV